jgi:hypothetical protein
MTETMTTSWADRLGEVVWVDPEQLLANPRNYRIHPQEQQEIVGDSLDTMGWIKPIIAVEGSDLVLDGHLRIALAMRAHEPAVPVQYVKLDESELAQALLILDTTVEMAGIDKALMTALINDVTPQTDVMNDFLSSLMASYDLDGAASADSAQDALDNQYSRVVTSPVYEITGECPEVNELVDQQRARDLIWNIEASSAPDEVKAFLRFAAYRHLKFDYAKVAEFYAHADADVQELMEQSALVIIDVDQAIELGFAKLAEELRQLSPAADDDAE